MRLGDGCGVIDGDGDAQTCRPGQLPDVDVMYVVVRRWCRKELGMLLCSCTKYSNRLTVKRLRCELVDSLAESREQRISFPSLRDQHYAPG